MFNKSKSNKISVEDLSHTCDMGRKKGKIIGVRLVADWYIPHSENGNQLEDGKVLGAVHISSDQTNCTHLRLSIKKHLVTPKDFCFFTSKGWPIEKSLEDQIQISDCILSDVVTIQAKNEFLKIGVKLTNGLIIGFIFLNFNFDLPHVRNLIMSDLSDHFESNETFHFVENNSWPVRKNQEKRLSLWDIVVNNCITILKKKLKRNIDVNDDKTYKKSKFDERPLLNLNKDELMTYDILISYVHSEAREYARRLKTELQNMGFKKIFLDVDDIPAGSDWQDIISGAVNKCAVFVALVTQRYGGTRWTSREAKLADGKEKFIIPVSFLDKWPPDELAIQFVTLQYIPWKTDEEVNDRNHSRTNNSLWSDKSVTRVAHEITKLYKEQNVSTPDSASLLENDSKATNFTMKLSDNLRSRINNRELIVISAHSKQNNLVKKVTKNLQQLGYNVWNSMSMCDCDENAFTPIEDTQPLLNSPAIENAGQSFSQHDKNTVDHSSNIKELKREFKLKVKMAKLVILIFSEDYMKSRVCNQQLYYCEQRKSSVVIKQGDFQIDSLILNLYPEHDMISSDDIHQALKFKINEKLKCDPEESYRNNILHSVSKLKNVINVDFTVFIIGGTNSVSPNAEQFCASLGTELAKIKDLNLATEGFFGAEDIVGKNFCEEQEILDKGKPPKVFHILPAQDSSDFSKRAGQHENGVFQKKTYGHTLYYGNSVSARDDIAAAAFKLCILIEGGERSATLAEKFLWNDCIVIPVLYNNNFIKNKQHLIESITKAPCGVLQSDWENLNRQTCSPDQRVASVKDIVYSLLNLRN